MTTAQLQQWIQRPEALNQESLYELRTLVARYPYFQTARLLYLKNLFLLHDIGFGAELRKSVLYVADRRSLFYLIEGDRYALRQREGAAPPLKEEEEPGVDRTLFLIDAFLSTLPDEQSQSSDLDYTMDYTAYLLREDADADPAVPDAETEAVQPLRGQALIDGFLSKMNEEEEQGEKAPESSALSNPVSGSAPVENEEYKEDEAQTSLTEVEDDSCFTETLAKIYIKQHRYEKALEIIKKLSLNYPKKNAYFADQIRFLEKLIINAKSK